MHVLSRRIRYPHVITKEHVRSRGRKNTGHLCHMAPGKRTDTWTFGCSVQEISHQRRGRRVLAPTWHSTTQETIHDSSLSRERPLCSKRLAQRSGHVHMDGCGTLRQRAPLRTTTRRDEQSNGIGSTRRMFERHRIDTTSSQGTYRYKLALRHTRVGEIHPADCDENDTKRIVHQHARERLQRGQREPRGRGGTHSKHGKHGSNNANVNNVQLECIPYHC